MELVGRAGKGRGVRPPPPMKRECGSGGDDEEGDEGVSHLGGWETGVRGRQY